MFGSIFYNCWAALLAFTVYFFITLSKAHLPTHILTGSFVVAIITFILMFAFRYLLAYVLYSPEESIYDNEITENERPIENSNHESNAMNNSMIEPLSTVEYKDENSEEIAKVVRTMMNQEDTIQSTS